MHLEIPEPCHENWQDMTPKEQGRFCDKCCKVVVDFTSMATEKVIQFINERKNDRVCGRFRPDQIVIPVEAKQHPFSHRAKVFLAALVFVFGGMLFTGCKTHHDKIGKVATSEFSQQGFNNSDSPAIKNVVPRDTTVREMHPKGEVQCVTPDTSQTRVISTLGGPVVVPANVKHETMGKPKINPK